MQTYFKDNFIKGAQPDNFTKYANLFAEQFLPVINNDKKKFEEIIAGIEHKSWRFFNREMRKACDQHCTDKKIMNHADFQTKWFYESVMLGRTGIGAKAAWADGTAPTKTAAKKATEPLKATTAAIKAPVQTTKAFTYTDRNDGWVRVPGGAYRKPKW